VSCVARHTASTKPKTSPRCPHCSRVCASDFGLRSHMRSHDKTATLSSSATSSSNSTDFGSSSSMNSVDVAYCCRWSGVELAMESGSCGPKEAYIRWWAKSLHRKGHFGGGQVPTLSSLKSIGKCLWEWRRKWWWCATLQRSVQWWRCGL